MDVSSNSPATPGARRSPTIALVTIFVAVFSPDSSERYLPGYPYSPGCTAKIDADRRGFTLLMPLLIARGGDNVYARDLGARDSLLVREYPTRPLFLLRPQSADTGAEPRFYALSRDSLARAWETSAR
jgi:hypothetical protein